MSPSKNKTEENKTIHLQEDVNNDVQTKEETIKEKPLKVSALRYDPDKSKAPVIVAAGSGFVAQNILNIAEKNGIPIYHDDSAATLLSKLEMGQEIPPELFQIVVNIYLSLLNLGEDNGISEKLFKSKNSE